MKKLILLALFSASFIAARIDAQVTLLYNNDFPTDQIAAATRPESAGKFEIESADDFLLPTGAHITSATFTGLLPSGFQISSVANVRVEIYRVFPNDSDVGRTSGHRRSAPRRFRPGSIHLRTSRYSSEARATGILASRPLF